MSILATFQLFPHFKPLHILEILSQSEKNLSFVLAKYSNSCMQSLEEVGLTNIISNLLAGNFKGHKSFGAAGTYSQGHKAFCATPCRNMRGIFLQHHLTTPIILLKLMLEKSRTIFLWTDNRSISNPPISL